MRLENASLKNITNQQNKLDLAERCRTALEASFGEIPTPKYFSQRKQKNSEDNVTLLKERENIEALEKKHKKIENTVSKLETQKAKLESKLIKEPIEEKKLVENSKRLSNWKKPIFF